MSKQNKYDKVNILGIECDLMTVRETFEYFENHLKSNNKTIYVVKPYVEFMTAASGNHGLAHIINQADLCLADGVSLQWAASFLYGVPKTKKTIFSLIKSLLIDIQNKKWREQIIVERGAGVDVTRKLLALASDKKWRVGIITGKTDQTPVIAQALGQIFPRLNLIDVWPGYFNKAEEENIIKEVAGLRLDILFVARGFPIQEKFIFQHKDAGLARIMIGEGGSFDYDQLGGNIKRAPVFMRRSGLEWLWRFMIQPRRITRMFAIPRFIWLVYLAAKRQK